MKKNIDKFEFRGIFPNSDNSNRNTGISFSFNPEMSNEIN